jgi:DNA-binding transcriptional LysR family regulator
MQFNKVDLNLFVVFDAIYTTGNLTRAGEMLHVTQPAVSNALSRLRDLFQDPLFVRTGQSMTPTPVAQNVIGPAREALRLLRQSVQDSDIFDPIKTDKTYNLCMLDLLEASIIPRLLARMASRAPNVHLHNHQMRQQDVVSAMARGHLDFYGDASTFSDPHLCKQRVAQDRFVCVARKDHPHIDDTLTMETFLKLGHIQVDERGEGSSHVDVALEKMGIQRKVVMRGHHFMTVPSVLVKTHLVVCIPFHFARHFDLAIYELPFQMPPLEYFLYWHKRADQDHANIWLRQQILEVTRNHNLTDSASNEAEGRKIHLS